MISQLENVNDVDGVHPLNIFCDTLSKSAENRVIEIHELVLIIL